VKHNQPQLSAIGIIGLGVMGRNLLLNMSDKGYSVAGFDRDVNQVNALADAAQKLKSQLGVVHVLADMKAFIKQLSTPRAVMLLVPAGTAVDSVIEQLLGHLDAGDMIIDGGNSYFKDTNRHSKELAKYRIHFLGVGISGGEAGARHGPSIMPGGPRQAYEQVRPIFEAIAAQVNGHPCATWLGSGSAGHFVKMVHNGIENAIMQLLAESFDFMKRGMGMNDDELQQTFANWNQGELRGYLINITSDIFAQADPMTSNRLIDEILDIAHQKGTGMWTSQSAMELQVPIPTIDAAVAMRDMSIVSKQRREANDIYQKIARALPLQNQAKTQLVEQLGCALYSAIIISFAQGMALLSAASEQYEYQLNNEAIARIWRGGCIIRADLLDDICTAYAKDPSLCNLLLDEKIATKLIDRQQDLRTFISAAIRVGIPLPTFMASLNYFDSYRSGWSPANLIQAQRDYFGSHTYERVDMKGSFHTQWNQLQAHQAKLVASHIN
jgi:6-phosphogluconate dehydrogenase